MANNVFGDAINTEFEILGNANNVFGDPITDETLEGVTEYAKKLRKLRVAMALDTQMKGNKYESALKYVREMKERWGTGVSTLCLVYNATGEPLTTGRVTFTTRAHTRRRLVMASGVRTSTSNDLLHLMAPMQLLCIAARTMLETTLTRCSSGTTPGIRHLTATRPTLRSIKLATTITSIGESSLVKAPTPAPSIARLGKDVCQPS
ncbi:unnamed protein product [Musa banksii]